MTIEVGDTVTLRGNAKFRARVLAVTSWGIVHLDVLDWAGEVGGYRGRDGVLSKTSYPESQLRRQDGGNAQ
ncbi:MAG: hypothetical protein H8D43_04415 [Chloroflexi bacterium]|nr:hypothetical protein [Chloroflexota bacterium]